MLILGSEAQGYADAINKGPTTIKGVSVNGTLLEVGKTGIWHDNKLTSGGNGVLLRVNSIPSYENNQGTRDNPNTSLKNYMLVKYTYATPVTFSDNVTIWDIDQSTGEHYSDAVALWYEDDSGIHPAVAETYGDNGSLKEFNTVIINQPNGIVLNEPVKGYGTTAALGNTNTNNKLQGTVNYNITTPVKAVYIAYWNGYDAGKKTSGFQGVRFCAPLPENIKAVDDRYETKIDTSVEIKPLNKDTYPKNTVVSKINGQNVTAGATIDVDNGQVTVGNNGKLTFTPNTGYTGVVKFPYEIKDSNINTSTAKEIITIMPDLSSCPANHNTIDFGAATNANGTEATSSIGAYTITGRTLKIGTADTAVSSPYPFVHGDNTAKGVEFLLPANKVAGNNAGTNTNPQTSLTNYTLIEYEFNNAIDFNSTHYIIIKDIDGGSNNYLDAVAVWVEDDSNQITPLEASWYGDMVIDLNYTVANQPDELALPLGKGYSSYKTGNNNDNVADTEPSWVIYPLADKYVKKIYIAYWGNSDSGKTPTGLQGIKFLLKYCVPLNQPPKAVNDSYTTKVNEAKTINPLDKDSDADGDAITIKSINGDALTGGAQTIKVPHGKVKVDASGAIKFEPYTDYIGSSSFPYVIEDTKGATANAVEDITIINNPPVAADDTYTTPLDTPVVINPLNADSDVNVGDAISIKSINGKPLTGLAQSINVPNGKVDISTSGEIKFVPNSGYTGAVHFPYVIEDRFGATATANETITVLTKVSAPTISVIESVDSTIDVNHNGTIEKDDKVKFKYVVENTGNTVLKGITLTDKTAGDVTCPKTRLNIHEKMTCYKEYPITAGDVAKGAVEASSTVTGFDENNQKATDVSDAGTAPNGTEVNNPEGTETPNPLKKYDNDTKDPTSDPVIYTIGKKPNVSLIESVCMVEDVNGNGKKDAGDKVKFKYVVTNTGNTDIDTLELKDKKVGKVDSELQSPLEPGDSAEFCKEYTITADDVKKGAIEASSTVKATDTDGKTAQDVSDAGTEPNTAPISNPEGVETPNPAKAFPNDANDPTDDPVSLALDNEPKIQLIESVERVTDTNGNGKIDAGDTVRFKYEITNTGNTVINQIVSQKDKKVGDIHCNLLSHKAPGGVKVCHKDYIITTEDVTAGTIEASSEVVATDENGKTVKSVSDAGTKPNGDEVANPNEEETPNPAHQFSNSRFNAKEDPTTYILNPKPAISIVKSIEGTVDENGDGVIWKDDTALFEYVVTNSGNVNLTNVAITNDENPLIAGSLTCPKTELAVGESMVCHAKHKINDTDIGQKAVIGKATVHAQDPKGGDVTADSDAGTDLKREPIADPMNKDTKPPVGNNPGADKNPTSLILIKANEDKPKTVTDYKDSVIDIAGNDKFIGKVKVEIIEPPKYGTAKVVYDKDGNPKIIYKADPDANNVNDSFKYRISDEYGNSDVAVADFELRCSSTQRKDGGSALGAFGIIAMFLSLIVLINSQNRRRV